MGEGFQFVEIIVLAMIAAAIGLRLHRVLGRRTGHERPPSEVVERNTERAQDPAQPATADARAELADTQDARFVHPDAATNILDLKLADRTFDTETFITGARWVYEEIVVAFAAGDESRLRPWVSDEVFAAFSGVIRDRRDKGLVGETTIVKLDGARIVDAALAGRMAEVTVQFDSEMVTVVRDAEGRVVEGHPSVARPVVDRWTFARDVRSRDPNWALIATGGAG